MPGILNHVEPSFYNDSGHVDALQVRDYLHIPTKDMAAIVGKSERRIRQDPTAESIQPTLQKLVKIITDLKDLSGGDDRSVRIWLKALHPALEDESALDLLRNGEIDLVRELIDHIQNGGHA